MLGYSGDLTVHYYLLTDPLLGLLVARIMDKRLKGKTGHSGCKGGFLLGSISRNIITTYLLPGYLSGVELDSHSNLSAKYKEAFESKGSSSFAPTVAPRGYVQKVSVEGKSPLPVDMPLGAEKAHKHREQCLLASFGTHGVDAVALSMVCAMWLQDCRTIDSVFQHCCSLGLLSAASDAHMPLLPLHTYGLFEAFLSSASSFSPIPSSTSSASSSAAFYTPHPLSPIAGHVMAEKVRGSISAAALVRWMLVSGTNKEAEESRSGCEDDTELPPLSLPSTEFKRYNNRNLNFNTQQLSNVLSSVELLVMDGAKQSAHRSVIMKVQGLKIKIMQSLAQQRRVNSRTDDPGENALYENDFKKACRSSFMSWKSAFARERAQQQDEEKNLSASSRLSLGAQVANTDIFDQPLRRAPRATQDVPAVSATSAAPAPAPASAPAPSPQAAFDIFDQPVRRAPRATQDVPAVSEAAASASPTEPVLALLPYIPPEPTDIDMK